MCGIAGFYSFGKNKPNKQELERLLIGIMDRGTDATGIAYILGERLHVHKKNIKASKFLREDHWKTLEIPSIMIMHTRQGTGGKAEDNMNNHPIFNKDGMALIHNGILYNEKDVYKELDITPDGEVDSEVLLHMLKGKWWKDIKNIEKVRGSYACASIYEKRPKELILFRHINPIYYYIDKQRDILFFASTSSILEYATCKTHRGFMTGNADCHSLEDDTAILISANGVADQKDITPAVYTSSYERSFGVNDNNNYRGYYEDDRDWIHRIAKSNSMVSKNEDERKNLTIYTNCTLCRAWSETKHSKLGEVCKDCYEFWFSEEYECPWCRKMLTHNDVDTGKCPYCAEYIQILDN